MTLQPINLGDESHAQGYYCSPIDHEKRRLQGSTTIIKKAHPPYLVNWASLLTATEAVDTLESWKGLQRDAAIDLLKRAPDRNRDKAGDKGTIVHRVIELAATGQAIDEVYDASVAGYISAGLRFLDDWQPRFLWTEATVFHPERGYAGTADFWAEIEALGGVVLGDWKTGKRVYDEVAMQLASYRYADHAVGIDSAGAHARLEIPEAVGAIVVHLKANGTYQLRPVNTDKRVYEAFLRSIDILDDKHALKGSVAKALPAPKLTTTAPTSGEVPASASSGNEPTGSLSTPATVRHTSPDNDLDARTAWLKARVTAIVSATPTAEALASYNVATAADLMAAWWPEGVPTLREGGHDGAQLDAIAERAGMVEQALGLPFPEPNPRFESDNVRIPADDERVVELVARLRALPADLLRQVETDAAAAGITAKVSLGLALGKLRVLDEIVERATEAHRARLEVLDDNLDEFAYNPFFLDALDGMYGDRRTWTAETGTYVGLICEAFATGFVVATDHSVEAGVDAESRLVPTVHANKRDALNHTKRAAKHHGVPAPKSFADVLGDPLLIALCISEIDDTQTATAAA